MFKRLLCSGGTNSEVALQVNHLGLDHTWLKHGDGSLLKGMHSTSIQVATA